ncbi:MAG TPA: class I SAM-dependent methyltransferase [Phenylobacterium sp.]|nr:class I SAM-dependent methyltransferase [Phenylobacterium sp.]
MAEFSRFDTRHYPTLPVREGYEAWADTYESTVLDLMDRRLLERLRSIDWPAVGRALDLACGTGRGGAWLKAKGVASIDGVDLTPAMLERASAKGLYDRLLLGDVASVDLPDGAYGLVTQLLADEHLDNLRPVYREAMRVAAPGGWFVLVGYHPWFLMAGIPTHFDRAPGEPIGIESHVHLFSDHVHAAHAAGWRLAEMEEGLVDDAWIEAKPKWAIHRDRPVSFALVWVKAARP